MRVKYVYIHLQLMRYFLRVSFKGTNYFGWQKQKTQNSVQQEIEKCLSFFFHQTTEVTGCGRTDTGVHALDYWLHFDIDVPFNTKFFLFRINQIFPNDIAAHQIEPVIPEAHARFSALKRTYQYKINLIKDPFSEEFSLYRYGELNIDKMNEVCKMILGEHDFSAFAKAGSYTGTNLCIVYKAEWSISDSEAIFTICANRFLRNMVRAITGTLLRVGTEKMDSIEFETIFKGLNRSNAADSVPAHALYLANIDYPTNLFLKTDVEN